LRKPKPGTLIREEKEGIVFKNGATHEAPEIVMTFRGTRQTCPIREPIIGVQDIVAEVFEYATMNTVRSRACRQDNLSPGIPTEYGSEGICLDAEFL
jgi:hypothetical protein